MKAFMNSAVCTMFFCMLATSLLLAHMGDAADGDKGKEKQQNNKAQELEDIRQIDIKFYETIVVPMAKDCETEENSGIEADVFNHKNKLCEGVKLSKKLYQWHEKHTKQIGTRRRILFKSWMIYAKKK
jgi:hypothetical protein